MQINTQNVLDKWTEYTLSNDNGMSVSFLNYGGIITKLITPNQDGLLENVVLGYQHYEAYEQNPNYFGAIIGRVAGRVQDASFELDGKKYKLEANEGAHHLHSGSAGFHNVIWEVSPFQTENQAGVILTHSSPAGEGGYPGRVKVKVTYTLTNKNDLLIDYEAISDEKTILTLTNHTYFNLAGQLKETTKDHVITINSDQFLELDQELIPTGKILNVANTPFDFRKGRKLLDGFQSDHQQNIYVGNGYDHYFLLNKTDEQSITVKENTSGRILKVRTNQPGVVMYTANGLTDNLKLNDGISEKHLGVCFETQGPSSSLHHDGLPSIVLEADEVYEKQTVFSFSCE